MINADGYLYDKSAVIVTYPCVLLFFIVVQKKDYNAENAEGAEVWDWFVSRPST